MPLTDVHSRGVPDGHALGHRDRRRPIAVPRGRARRQRHPHPRGLDAASWATLKTQATSAPGAVAVVGDFNSTRWNPPFGDLLAAGLHDAHESVGQGLSRSWPNLGFPVPLMRLDHALVNDKVGVVSVHDVDVPGSDHIGFVTELAVGA